MRRSLMANFLDQLVQIKYRKKSPEEVEKFLKKKILKGESTYSLPFYLRFRSDINEHHTDGQQVYYLNSSSESDTLVVYLHGGAFVDEITPFHWKAIDRIAHLSGCPVIVPLYELMPYATHKEAFEFVEDVYSHLLLNFPEKKVVFMGDSAGAGLALSVCEYFTKNNICLPEKLVLFSPWLDVSMSNQEMNHYTDRDVMLSPPGLKVYGKHWAGSLDTQDYRVSPMFGDVECLDNVTMFVGSDEIFYPDIVNFYERIKNAGKNCRLYIGQNLGHAYPIFPTREGRQAIKEAAKKKKKL